MSIKISSASYVAELTEGANGSVSITVTPQEWSEGSYVPLATETYWDIFVTLQKLWREERNIFANLLLYRC